MKQDNLQPVGNKPRGPGRCAGTPWFWVLEAFRSDGVGFHGEGAWRNRAPQQSGQFQEGGGLCVAPTFRRWWRRLRGIQRGLRLRFGPALAQKPGSVQRGYLPGAEPKTDPRPNTTSQCELVVYVGIFCHKRNVELKNQPPPTPRSLRALSPMPRILVTALVGQWRTWPYQWVVVSKKWCRSRSRASV